MNERYLVDTSLWIDALRPGGREDAARWLKAALLAEAVVLAPPVKAELMLGARDERQLADLEEMLAALPLLESGSQIWETAARLGFRARRKGIVVPLVDLLVASWAAADGCVLAHRDRHYELIKEEAGIRTLSFLP
ncbi:MAG: PIN domain-containing protein [Moorella sp. (in: Bacteria)]|nr:PIN domain-containing protein [Moorella sp. (in: firmicutes)]